MNTAVDAIIVGTVKILVEITVLFGKTRVTGLVSCTNVGIGLSVCVIFPVGTGIFVIFATAVVLICSI